MSRVYLLTGRPGVGKTTCIKRALERAAIPAGGFLTEEIRDRGRRIGFSLHTIDGERAVLAHVQRPGPPRVGKYGVDVDALERVGVPSIRHALRDRRVVVVDEIGKMEMASAAFREAIEETLASSVSALGTILLSPHPWADRIKRHPAVEVITVTLANRDAIPELLLTRLRAGSGAPLRARSGARLRARSGARLRGDASARPATRRRV